MAIVEFIGWLGGIALALCGVPLALDVWKKQDASHVNSTFLGTWFFGEVCALLYVIVHSSYPLIFNYVFNLATLLVIYWVKFRTYLKIRNTNPW